MFSEGGDVGRVKLLWNAWISPDTIDLGVYIGVMDLTTFVPTHDSKTGCGDHFSPWIPIPSLSNHSSYLLWDIGRVKLMSIAWIGTNTLDLGEKSRGVDLKLSPPPWLKSQGAVMSVRNEFQSQPSINIHYTYMMRWWKGQAAVKCLNRSRHTWSWCEKWVWI